MPDLPLTPLLAPTLDTRRRPHADRQRIRGRHSVCKQGWIEHVVDKTDLAIKCCHTPFATCYRHLLQDDGGVTKKILVSGTSDEQPEIGDDVYGAYASI